MAKTLIAQYTSDLSGKPIKDGEADTVSFSLDGTSYEIDLSTAEAQKLREIFQPYKEAGRRVTTGTTRRASKPSGPPAAEIRAWAQANGMECPERGRIPADVREAFEAAN